MLCLWTCVGQDPKLSTFQDINAITGALKSFLRSLPTPLIHGDCYTDLMDEVKSSELNLFLLKTWCMPLFEPKIDNLASILQKFVHRLYTLIEINVTICYFYSEPTCWKKWWAGREVHNVSQNSITATLQCSQIPNQALTEVRHQIPCCCYSNHLTKLYNFSCSTNT